MTHSLPKANTETPEREIADYFGLLVEVISCMQRCSLIRYRDRVFIVNTEDLYFGKSLRCAA
jgi:hypothetical protein